MKVAIKKAIEMLEKYAGIERPVATHCGACTDQEIVEVKEIADEILKNKVDSPKCVWLAAHVRGDEALFEGVYKLSKTCSGDPRQCAALCQVEIWLDKGGVRGDVASKIRIQHRVSCFDTCPINPSKEDRPTPCISERDVMAEISIPEGFGYDA